MVSGRRDFNSEFSEQMEKHLHRLPESVQHGFTAARNAAPTRRRDARDEPSGSISEPPVVAEIRDRWQQWNSAEAKLERRKKRTSATLTLWSILTVLSVLLLWGASGQVALVAGTSFGVIFGALTVRSSLRLWRLSQTQLPDQGAGRSANEVALPERGSMAREPMERLADGEASLEDLLMRLETPTGGTNPTSEIPVEQTRATAADAAATLRDLASRIQAIERARQATPETETSALESAVRSLRQQLDQGVDGYGALVGAAGRAVAASSGSFQAEQTALVDATDRLAGLAVAMREVS